MSEQKKTVHAALKAAIRTVRNWPCEGVNFRDITPLMNDGETFCRLIDAFVDRYRSQSVDVIAGIDARGFILAAPVAHSLRCSFVPVRKKGKLPFATLSETYKLEYGESCIEIHADAFPQGARVVLMDDLIATGGTMLAAASLIRRAGGDLLECAAIIDLPELGGSRRIRASGAEIFSICSFLEAE